MPGEEDAVYVAYIKLLLSCLDRKGILHGEVIVM